MKSSIDGRTEHPLREHNAKPRLLERNPFFWLSCRDRFAPSWPFVFALIIVGATGWCIFHYEIPKAPGCVLLIAALSSNDLTMRTRIASIAATRLAEDRQSGALEMILSAPVTIKEIIKGQWKAIRHIQLPTYCAQHLLTWPCSRFFSRKWRVRQTPKSVDSPVLWSLSAILWSSVTSRCGQACE